MAGFSGFSDMTNGIVQGQGAVAGALSNFAGNLLARKQAQATAKAAAQAKLDEEKLKADNAMALEQFKAGADAKKARFDAEERGAEKGLRFVDPRTETPDEAAARVAADYARATAKTRDTSTNPLTPAEQGAVDTHGIGSIVAAKAAGRPVERSTTNLPHLLPGGWQRDPNMPEKKGDWKKGAIYDIADQAMQTAHAEHKSTSDAIMQAALNGQDVTTAAAANDAAANARAREVAMSLIDDHERTGALSPQEAANARATIDSMWSGGGPRGAAPSAAPARATSPAGTDPSKIGDAELQAHLDAAKAAAAVPDSGVPSSIARPGWGEAEGEDEGPAETAKEGGVEEPTFEMGEPVVGTDNPGARAVSASMRGKATDTGVVPQDLAEESPASFKAMGRVFSAPKFDLGAFTSGLAARQPWEQPAPADQAQRFKMADDDFAKFPVMPPPPAPRAGLGGFQPTSQAGVGTDLRQLVEAMQAAPQVNTARPGAPPIGQSALVGGAPPTPQTTMPQSMLGLPGRSAPQAPAPAPFAPRGAINPIRGGRAGATEAPMQDPMLAAAGAAIRQALTPTSPSASQIPGALAAGAGRELGMGPAPFAMPRGAPPPGMSTMGGGSGPQPAPIDAREIAAMGYGPQLPGASMPPGGPPPRSGPPPSFMSRITSALGSNPTSMDPSAAAGIAPPVRPSFQTTVAEPKHFPRDDELTTMQLPGGRTARLMPDAAQAFGGVLSDPSLTPQQRQILSQVASSTRSPADQDMLAWDRQLGDPLHKLARNEDGSLVPAPEAGSVPPESGHLAGTGLDLPESIAADPALVKLLEAKGWRRKLGGRDPVHWEYRAKW